MTHPKLVSIFNPQNKATTNSNTTSADMGNSVNYSMNINNGAVDTLLDKKIQFGMKNEEKKSKLAKERQKAIQKKLLRQRWKLAHW